MQEKFNAIQGEINKMNDEKSKVDKMLSAARKEADKLHNARDIVFAALEKVKKPNEAIDSQLSCLSCLNYLSKEKP